MFSHTWVALDRSLGAVVSLKSWAALSVDPERTHAQFLDAVLQRKTVSTRFRLEADEAMLWRFKKPAHGVHPYDDKH